MHKNFKLIIFFFLIVFFVSSCFLSERKRMSEFSNLLPESFQLDSIKRLNCNMSGEIKIYYFKNTVFKKEAIKNYPIEIGGDNAWSFREWHLVKNETEFKRIRALLSVVVSSYTYSNLKGKCTKLINTLKEGIADGHIFVGYYFKDVKNTGYYYNGYTDFYCLLPKQNKLVYIIYEH